MRTFSVQAGEGRLRVTLEVARTGGQGLACFLQLEMLSLVKEKNPHNHDSHHTVGYFYGL